MVLNLRNNKFIVAWAYEDYKYGTDAGDNIYFEDPNEAL